jgi:hypothetical protein
MEGKWSHKINKERETLKSYRILPAFPVTCWTSRSGESIFVKFLQLVGQLYCVRSAICTISLVSHTCCKSNFAKSWLHSILSDNRIHEHVGSVEGSLTDCAIYPSRKTSGLPVSPTQSPVLWSKSWNDARILKDGASSRYWKANESAHMACLTNPSSQASFEIAPSGQWPTESQPKSTTLTNCCIYIVYLLMIGYKYARNM